MNTAFLTRTGLLACAILAVAASNLAAGGDDDDPRVPFETMVQGTYANRRDSGQEVIRSQTEYERIWRQTQHSENPDDLPQEIDFQSEMVIALFMGRQNTGGYSIEVEEIRAGDRRATVYYREYSPGPGEMRTQALTSPFHLVRVQRLERDIRFSRRN